MKENTKYFTEERKQYYELWYHYLIKNEKFKTLCGDFDSAIKHPLYIAAWSTMENWTRDIHKVTFEEWWIWRKNKRLSNELSYQEWKQCGQPEMKSVWYAPGSFPEPVDSAQPWLIKFIDAQMELYKELNGRNPSAKELRNNIATHLEISESEEAALYLRVSLLGRYSYKKDLAPLIKNIVESKRNKLIIPEFPNFSTGLHLSYFVDLRRYLFEYIEYYEKHTPIPDIVEKVSKENVFNKREWANSSLTYTEKSHIDDTVSQEISKAKTIIENTLYNIFPGNYDKTRKKKTGKESPTSELIQLYKDE